MRDIRGRMVSTEIVNDPMRILSYSSLQVKYATLTYMTHMRAFLEVMYCTPKVYKQCYYGKN